MTGELFDWKSRLRDIAALGGLALATTQGSCGVPNCNANPDPCCQDPGGAACKAVEACTASPNQACCYMLNTTNYALYQACEPLLSDGGSHDGGIDSGTAADSSVDAASNGG